ncbi:hypothetical protein D4A81_06840 [Lachnoanaerobaculum umeaense]|uniref:Conjugal transfer protein TraX n=2 Tax=Lachnoanaerobaculum umeaense TaxID=617123 RepID=A0A385Q0I0_9FIRM|nr:hypothetical protein D4A81_06840 [Lachnoanaerobaculum umeaense]
MIFIGGIIMNTKRLKIIAIISMLIDHIPRIIPWQMWIAIAESISLSFPGKEELVSEIVIDRVPGIMGYIGRLAAPIFMFCITVGFRYTKNIKKYIFRVFTFAFISQIPYILFTQSEEYASGFSKLELTPFYKIDLNIMFTLGFGLVALYFYEKIKDKNTIIRLTPIIAAALISYVLNTEGGYIYIVYIFMFYLLRDVSILKKAFIWIFIIVICRLPLLFHLLQINNDIMRALPTMRVNTVGVYVGAFLTFFFNNKKTHISKTFKYLMYLFYPVHLILLYFTYLLLSSIF